MTRAKRFCLQKDPVCAGPGNTPGVGINPVANERAEGDYSCFVVNQVIVPVSFSHGGYSVQR